MALSRQIKYQNILINQLKQRAKTFISVKDNYQMQNSASLYHLQYRSSSIDEKHSLTEKLFELWQCLLNISAIIYYRKRCLYNFRFYYGWDLNWLPKLPGISLNSLNSRALSLAHGQPVLTHWSQHCKNFTFLSTLKISNRNSSQSELSWVIESKQYRKVSSVTALVKV